MISDIEWFGMELPVDLFSNREALVESHIPGKLRLLGICLRDLPGTVVSFVYLRLAGREDEPPPGKILRIPKDGES